MGDSPKLPSRTWVLYRFLETASPDLGQRPLRQMPTSLLTRQEVAAAVAIYLQPIVLLLLQVSWHGQFPAQDLQLFVEIRVGVTLEEAKHQQVRDALILEA